MSGVTLAAAATWAWLSRQFGRRAPQVARAWRQALDPSTERGRLILADLVRLTGAAQTSFVPGDVQETAFNEGKRAVFLHVAAVLGLGAAEIAQFGQEQASDED